MTRKMTKSLDVTFNRRVSLHPNRTSITSNSKIRVVDRPDEDSGVVMLISQHLSFLRNEIRNGSFELKRTLECRLNTIFEL